MAVLAMHPRMVTRAWQQRISLPMQAVPGAWLLLQMHAPCYGRIEPAYTLWISSRSCVGRVQGCVVGRTLPSMSMRMVPAWALPLLCFAVVQPQCCDT